jgi:hypothetical protein
VKDVLLVKRVADVEDRLLVDDQRLEGAGLAVDRRALDGGFAGEQDVGQLAGDDGQDERARVAVGREDGAGLEGDLPERQLLSVDGRGMPAPTSSTAIGSGSSSPWASARTPPLPSRAASRAKAPANERADAARRCVRRLW